MAMNIIELCCCQEAVWLREGSETDLFIAVPNQCSNRIVLSGKNIYPRKLRSHDCSFSELVLEDTVAVESRKQEDSEVED